MEVKTSRSDFENEKRKLHFRMPGHAMGNYRFYCCPFGLLKVGGIPKKYGLLYLSRTGKRIKIMRNAGWQESNRREEHGFLLSVVRRFKATATINGDDFRNYLNFIDKRRKADGEQEETGCR